MHYATKYISIYRDTSSELWEIFTSVKVQGILHYSYCSCSLALLSVASIFVIDLLMYATGFFYSIFDGDMLLSILFLEFGLGLSDLVQDAALALAIFGLFTGGIQGMVYQLRSILLKSSSGSNE